MKAIRKNIALPVSGTFNIPVEPTVVGQQIYSHWIVTGTETLINDFDIQPIGTELRYTSIDILWNANLDLDGNTVNIFGKDVPTTLIEAGLFLTNCFYNGTAWVVTFFISTEDGVIDTDMIKDLAITEAKVADNSVTLAKMYELATGNVIFGNASNRPTALSVADSTIVVGDSSTGLVSVAVSGDATLAKSGALTIAANAITTAKITDGDITLAKLEDKLLYDMFNIRLDTKSAAATGNVNFTMPYDCDITHIVITALEAPTDDDASFVFKDNGSASMGSIDVPTTALIGNKFTLGSAISPLSSNNSFTGYPIVQNLLIEVSKTTQTSGAYEIFIYTKRT